jgi:hypothetical protein
MALNSGDTSAISGCSSFSTGNGQFHFRRGIWAAPGNGAALLDKCRYTRSCMTRRQSSGPCGGERYAGRGVGRWCPIRGTWRHPATSSRPWVRSTEVPAGHSPIPRWKRPFSDLSYPRGKAASSAYSGNSVHKAVQPCGPNFPSGAPARMRDAGLRGGLGNVVNGQSALVMNGREGDRAARRQGWMEELCTQWERGRNRNHPLASAGFGGLVEILWRLVRPCRSVGVFHILNRSVRSAGIAPGAMTSYA